MKKSKPAKNHGASKQLPSSYEPSALLIPDLSPRPKGLIIYPTIKYFLWEKDFRILHKKRAYCRKVCLLPETSYDKLPFIVLTRLIKHMKHLRSLSFEDGFF